MHRAALVSFVLAFACGSDSESSEDGGSSGGDTSTTGDVATTQGETGDGSSTGAPELPWPPDCVTADPPSCATLEITAVCGDWVESVNAQVWQTVYSDAAPYDQMLTEADVCAGPLRLVAEVVNILTGEAIAASYAYTSWDVVTDMGYSYHCEAYRLLPQSGYLGAGDQEVQTLEGADLDPRSMGDELPKPPPMAVGNGCCLLEGVPLAGSEWEKTPCP